MCSSESSFRASCSCTKWLAISRSCGGTNPTVPEGLKHPRPGVFTPCRQLHPALISPHSSNQAHESMETAQCPLAGSPQRTGMPRGCSTLYLEGEVPILLRQLVDFSVHLAFFSLQVLALPKGLVQTDQEAAGRGGCKTGGQGHCWGPTLLGFTEKTKYHHCPAGRNCPKPSSEQVPDTSQSDVCALLEQNGRQRQEYQFESDQIASN